MSYLEVTGMKTLETVCDGFMLSERSPTRDHASARAPVVVRVDAFRIPFKISTLSAFCIIALVLSSPYLVTVSAIPNFNVTSTGYDCKSNMICLSDAHRYNGTGSSSKIQAGRLSLVSEAAPLSDFGVAYYNEAVRLKDPSSGKVASFNTSFSIDNVLTEYPLNGDGMTFVISGDNNTLGSNGRYFGIFDVDQTTHFKSIVVEFDGFKNNFHGPANDISSNHVSLDIGNLTWVAAKNASDVGVEVWSNASTIYAWVEYSQETQQFEVRISNNNSRPVNPFISYTLDLFTYIDEYMWIGFSGANGDLYSNYYIGAWTFASYGIPPVGPPPSSKGKNLGVILGVSVGVSAALLLVCISVVVILRRRSLRNTRRKAGHWLGQDSHEPNDSIILLEGMPERFSYEELSEATGAFGSESELGHGGFGTVHRGVLPSSGIPVAVKKIRSESNQGEKEFLAEMSIISRLSHRNLIQLLGWCKDSSKGSYLLVYELMSNGSLDKVLFEVAGNERSVSLSWEKRFNIVMGTARALDYLHEGWKQQVLHRDIKSSNIMLDEYWNPKLGDFGLARLVDHEQTAATTLVAGTYGYISPEIAISGKFTDKSDVFAFGAVVLEIACGRRALQRNARPPDEMLLVNWVWDSLSEGVLLSTVDKRLTDYNEKEMEELLIVGLLCSHPNPLSRPSMRHVVQILAGEVPVPPIPTSKPDIVFTSDTKARIKDNLSRNPSSHSTRSSIPGTSSTSRSKSISSALTDSSERTGASTEMV